MQDFPPGNHIPWFSRLLFQFFREILMSKEQEGTGEKVWWGDRLLQLHSPSDLEQRCKVL